MSRPAHIDIIMNLPLGLRTAEETKMLDDYMSQTGEYSKGNKFENTGDSDGSLHWYGQNQGGYHGNGGKEWNSKVFKRCYETHPALPIILKDGTERLVYGGSCSSPIHDDADIYVGLDYSMKRHPQRFPWVDGQAIHYEVKDGNIPANLAEFRLLVEWMALEIDAGKKVHIGCIGGHGRTGFVLAALVAHMSNEADPIAYVRANYCKKAVESKVQVKMLMQEYGCKDAKGSKEGTSLKSVGGTPKKHTVPALKCQHSLWPNYDKE